MLAQLVADGPDVHEPGCELPRRAPRVRFLGAISTLAPRALALALASWAATASAQEAACADVAHEAQELFDAHRDREAAQELVALARRSDPPCEGRDQILFLAAIAYDRARLVGRAIQVRQALVSNFPSSPLVPGTIYAVARNYHAMAVFSEAADWYYALARRYPTFGADDCAAELRSTPGLCADASVALGYAFGLYAQLGLEDDAIECAELFARNYAHVHPARTARISLDAAMLYDEPDDLTAALEDFLATYAATAELDVLARGLVALARTYVDQGRADDAAPVLARLIALVTPEALDHVADGHPSREVIQFRARDALAEAQFLTTEQVLVSVEPPPAPTGRHTVAGLEAWGSGPLARWRDRQLSAITPVLDAYAQIGAGSIPRWAIAAYQRIGDLSWLVVEAAVLQDPPDWAADDDRLLDALDAARALALASVQTRALRAYATCAELARTARWPSVRSERCADRLAQIDPAHYDAPRELRSSAGWIPDDTAPLLPAAPTFANERGEE